MARLQSDARRQDTREKIQLGGLVTKAGLTEEDTAVLLGAFLEIASSLAGPDAEMVRRRYRRSGDARFKADENAVSKRAPAG